MSEQAQGPNAEQFTYWNEDVRQQMKVVASDEVGINSFKMFMAYKDVMMLRDDEMLEVCMDTCLLNRRTC